MPADAKGMRLEMVGRVIEMTVRKQVQICCKCGRGEEIGVEHRAGGETE